MKLGACKYNSGHSTSAVQIICKNHSIRNFVENTEVGLWDTPAPFISIVSDSVIPTAPGGNVFCSSSKRIQLWCSDPNSGRSCTPTACSPHGLTTATEVRIVITDCGLLLLTLEITLSRSASHNAQHLHARDHSFDRKTPNKSDVIKDLHGCRNAARSRSSHPWNTGIRQLLVLCTEINALAIHRTTCYKQVKCISPKKRNS